MSTSFDDTAEIKTSTETIRKLTPKQWVYSRKSYIRGSKGIRWALCVCGGDNFLSCRVYLWVSKGGLRATGTVTVGSARPSKWAFARCFSGTNTKVCVVDELASKNLGDNGTINVKVTFMDFEKGYTPGLSTVFDFITASPHYDTDARINVDEKVIEVHRHFLCMISPVFQAEFTHDTAEAKTGNINITDFDYETVKNVIDYCYGRDVEAYTLNEVINMLVFADKYDIKVIITKFEPFLVENLSLDNFVPIASYAWDYEKVDLKTLCADFYQENHANITLTAEFRSLNPSRIVDIMNSAAAFERCDSPKRTPLFPDYTHTTEFDFFD